jgi:rhomboid protease GluP
VQIGPHIECGVTWSLFGIIAVASVVALAYTHEQFPLGAFFGPSVAGGQWWLLLTACFVHNSFVHFTSNMVPFLFFGRRLERILGHWTFLAFYLTCGVTASLVSVIAHPEAPGYGASGAVFAVCAGLIAHSSLRLHRFSRKQWIKLAVLVAFAAFSAWPSRPELHVDNAAHIAGLSAGLLLGFILSLPFAHSAVRRCAVFSAAAFLLVLGAAAFRWHDLYLVHLDSAARAKQSGKLDVAARELHTALAMKPDSPVGEFLLRKLEQDRPIPEEAVKDKNEE